MAIYNMGVIHPRLAFVGVEICTSCCFLAHNFGSRYARQPLKGPKDADHSLVFTKTWSKNMAYWVGAQGQVKLAQRSRKHALSLTSSPENPKPKTKNILFLISTRRPAESVDALNSPLAQWAGELWSCKNLKSRVKKVALAWLKGF